MSLDLNLNVFQMKTPCTSEYLNKSLLRYLFFHRSIRKELCVQFFFFFVLQLYSMRF